MLLRKQHDSEDGIAEHRDVPGLVHHGRLDGNIKPDFILKCTKRCTVSITQFQEEEGGDEFPPS
jgi:hypothetical protein